MPFQPVTNVDHMEEAIAKAGTSTTKPWKPCKGAEGFKLQYFMASTTAPSITWSLQICNVPPGFRPDETNIGADGKHLLDPDSTVRNNYRTVEIVAAATTQDEWVYYPTPTELKYPFMYYRSVIVEGNVGAVDSISTKITFNGMR